MENKTELTQSERTVVDVRTFAEYAESHLERSINIPLNEIPTRLDEFKGKQNLIVCCASGIRSRKAADLLKQSGIECYDGGSWLSLKNLFALNQQ
jgi:phage shock protein E